MTTRTTASAQQTASQATHRLPAECRETALAGEPNMLPLDAALMWLTCVLAPRPAARRATRSLSGAVRTATATTRTHTHAARRHTGAARRRLRRAR